MRRYLKFSPKRIVKPRYIAIAAITLDGKIARHKKHFTDWTSKEDKFLLKKLLDTCDLVIVGRHTYEVAKRPLRKRNCIVFTKSVPGVFRKRANLTYCNPQKININSLIKELGYRSVAILGGTQIFSYFLEKNLLDEFYLTIEPIIFGSGLPIFQAKFKIRKVKIVSLKKLNRKGTILIHFTWKS